MMSTPDTIRPRRLADDIQDRLLGLIRDDALKPGDALPSERDLMTRYDVGRPAVREALQSLSHMGVIDIRHGGRARLAEPSLPGLMDRMGVSMRHVLTHEASTLDHLKEARLALECHTAGLAAARRTQADIDALRALHIRHCQADATTEAFTALDGQFHTRIAMMSGNPIFVALVQSVFDWMRAFHRDQVRAEGKESLTLSEHDAILDAIEAGDSPAVMQAMKNHLSRANASYERDPDQ